MNAIPQALEGEHTRLEPLSMAHGEALVSAAGDGELWNSTVTVVPSPGDMSSYIGAALQAQARGRELPFAIFSKSLGRFVGSTRFRNIERSHQRVEIGSTWLGASAQRTAINTETKLLLPTHAFDQWCCKRVEFLTDVLNEQSRRAILRLGATQEGILRNHMIMPGGSLRDSVCFSLIASEWPAAKTRLQAKLALHSR